jgi:tetratricopeptide (TPR) repeat protein
MENKELKQITNQLNKKAINSSAKKRNYLIATIFTTLIIGIFAYQYYEEKKEVKELVDSMMIADSLHRNNDAERRYNKYIKSGLSKDSLGDYRGAIADCSKAIELNPNNSMAYYLCGLFKFNLKEYKNAIIDFNGAIRIDSSSSDAYISSAYKYSGISKYNLKEYKNAIIDFNGAIRIDSNSSDAYLYRGFCKSLSNDKNGACLDWKKAGELGYGEAYDLIKEHCN